MTARRLLAVALLGAIVVAFIATRTTCAQVKYPAHWWATTHLRNLNLKRRVAAFSGTMSFPRESIKRVTRREGHVIGRRGREERDALVHRSSTPD